MSDNATTVPDDQYELIWARDLRDGHTIRGLNNTTLPVVGVERCLFWDGPVDLAPVIVDFGQHGSWRYVASDTVSVMRLDSEAIDADDELLDRLGSAIPGIDPIGTPDTPMTELDAVLICHRLAVEADPIPDLVDVDTAIDVIKASTL